MDTYDSDMAITQVTDEQRAAMEEWIAPHPYGEQDENGVDLSLLRRNLRMTPTERLRRLEQAANDMLRMVGDARARRQLPRNNTAPERRGHMFRG